MPKLIILIAITAVMCSYVYYTAPRFPPSVSHHWLTPLTGVYLNMMTIMVAQYQIKRVCWHVFVLGVQNSRLIAKRIFLVCTAHVLVKKYMQTIEL